MPYVKCPSCELVSYSAAAYAALECCPHCGAGLPLRRVGVSLASQPRAAPVEIRRERPIAGTGGRGLQAIGDRALREDENTTAAEGGDGR